MVHGSPELFSQCPSQMLVSSVSSLSARPAGGLHCSIARQGLQAVYVAWPSWESPLFLFFVSAEGEAMCRNGLVLLGSLVACPQSGLGPVCTACIPQGPGLQTSAEASCLVCSSLFLESLATHSQGHSGCIRSLLLPFVWELLALVRYVDVLLICPHFWKEVGGSDERKSHKMSNPAAAV